MAGRSEVVTVVVETAEILDAVHRAAGGESVFVGVVNRDEPRLLTKRQEEVFGYLSKDTPYAMIALEMKIGVQTVRTHAKALFRKLGVRNRQELIGKRLPDASGPRSG